ncbi:adenosylcobinamide-phosphate synthase CbiB [Gilvimarinus polysaccharolyticus]|uniref:adenosylcobinamide-phosphate synthase CbiB n=1 Tax=Gilvimarinus polysaccharolyticus TaxID=863921 RepID=UPI000673A868|nr:adenosylcobinamide-phosphate synthase CbiB [Gilvimarinus polysaccharolyticus]
MVTAIALLLAVLLDYRLGEPARFHPLVGFGFCADKIEQRLNRSAINGRLMGVLALLLCLVPALLVSSWLWWWLLKNYPLLAIVVGAIGLYFTVGWRSLLQHVMAVQVALETPDLPKARAAVGRIVSRDCEQADSLQVRRAALESLLENSADAVVAPLFWFAVAGLPGAIVYRLSNTLDAMWGYKNNRFWHFGWAAARWDDVLNFLPARLTALAFAAVGDAAGALQSWRNSAGNWASPNAGPVISAGAGALQLSLGGGAFYHKRWQDKPATAGAQPAADAIPRAVALVNRALVLLVVVFMLAALFINGAIH